MWTLTNVDPKTKSQCGPGTMWTLTNVDLVQCGQTPMWTTFKCFGQSGQH